MNQFGLIIHETTAGSNLQFVSSHLDVNSPEIKETITDERTLASQLANMSDVYAVQITKNYKVYSLIVTNHTDFLGRSGFYAIRLYGPKGLNLMNFEKNLSDIKDRYIADTTSNNLNNQNYDDILSSILIVENDRKDFISLKNNVNCFYYFDDNTSTLSTVFNTKGINLVHKVYAFNKTKAVPESIALSSGLKSYSQINTSQKEINIVNSHSILKELKINNQNVDFNPNVSDFNLICQSSDSVLYNTTDDKNFRQIANNFISIERKYVPRPVPKPNVYKSTGNKKKSSSQDVVIYIAIIVLIVLLGGGFMFYDNIYKIINPQPEGTSTRQEEIQTNSPTDTIKKIVFEFVGDKKDMVFKTNFSKLEKYRFRFDNKLWSYKNEKGQNKYEDFYRETINEIKKVDSLDFDEDKFKKSLEEISGGKEILNKKNIKPKQNNEMPIKINSLEKTKTKSAEKGFKPTETKQKKSDELEIGI